MPSHKFESKTHSSSCSRCGVIRTSHHLLDSGRSSELPAWLWSYRLPDGHGSLDNRPKCADKGESRRTRKMGRRSKVLARHRAGGPRLLSREEKARRARTPIVVELSPVQVAELLEPVTTESLDMTGGVEVQASMTTTSAETAEP